MHVETCVRHHAPDTCLMQVKEFLLEANWTTATSAKKYTAWTRRQVGSGHGDREACLLCADAAKPVPMWGAPTQAMQPALQSHPNPPPPTHPPPPPLCRTTSPPMSTCRRRRSCAT